MPSKFGQFLAWFRDSQTPSRVHTARAVRSAHAQAVSVSRDIELRSPHYYVFFYPEGREPGSGWKHPKAYFGPFTTFHAAKEGLKKSWPAKAGESRKRFQIKHLTSAQFEKIWGALPGHAAGGY